MPREKLLLDVMLGGLPSYLRMCGYDTVYALDRDVEADDRLLEIARKSDRDLLTRDVELANRAATGVLLESRDVDDQLRELSAAGFDLTLTEYPERCGSCNGRLDPLGPDANAPETAPEDLQIWRCRACGKHFWQGGHWDRVADALATVR
jgi:hypothetical protein